ncbi:MAG: fused MFS/spermidine synthase [Aquabacterium sp.]|nr:fused MFS/spermidine synthase [Aquabacterium sp.]
MPARSQAGVPALALVVMLASGFAGLGYQIVWTQQVAQWLGHDGAAVLAVVGGFFGGLAVGALAVSRHIDRSTHPARWYAGCELLIALWAAALVWLMAPASQVLMASIGAQPAATWPWLVALFGTFLLLLPATAAMGATLPALQRLLAGPGAPAAHIGWLYAGNTAGAVLGVLASAFWLVPWLGLSRTALVCAVLNLACAVVALTWRTRPVSAAGVAAQPAPASAAPGGGRMPWWWPLAATGALGIGYEVLAVRVLSQVAENTVYTFAILLAVYLVATSAGAALWQRRSAGHAAAARLPLLLQGVAAACLLGGAAMWQADMAKPWLLQALGPSMGAALAAEAGLALLAFGLPAAMMGALFSHLCTQAGQAGHGFARCLGANTLGAALAPLCIGVLLLPAAGAKVALLVLVAGYLALVPWRSWRMPLAACVALAVVATAAWAPALRFIDVPEGGRIISHQDGAMAAVSVVEDADGVSRLHIDNRQQEGSSHSLVADARQALLPLLLHPAPRQALFLGLGTGTTAASAAQDRQLQVHAVELLPEVITASRHFTQAFDAGKPNPRLQLLQADARRFVRADTRRYDLVVSDNFHPARSGSAALYTVQHFQAVANRLAPGGVFCQWLPLHQLDLQSLRSVVKAYITAFPGAFAMLATNSLDTPVLGLVAHGDGQPFNLQALRSRLASADLGQQPPADFGIHDDLALLGGFVADARALAAFAGDAPVNTDDHPVVAYLAPRITYAPDSRPRERLMALLQQLSLAPGALLIQEPEPGWNQRLQAYWSARNAFLAAGQAVRPVADVRQMLAQVQQPLLAVLRTSPDFRPAYDPLLQMAGALARSDPAAARLLLGDLAQLQPARPEAGAMLGRLPTQQP